MERAFAVSIRPLSLAIGSLAVLLIGVAALRVWSQPDHVEGHAYPVPSADEGLTVEVLNGTDRRGLARAATRILRHAGHDVVYFGNAPTPTDSTMILIRRGEPPGERIRAVLGVGTVAIEIDTLRRVDASVILGRDFEPPAEVHP